MKKLMLLIISIASLCNPIAAFEPSPAYRTIDDLALAAGTDKSSAYHNYTKIYAQYFDSIRMQPLKFLEIGIFKGDSVKLWENYFPNADLHFVDITSIYIKYFSPRAQYHFADQENFTEMENLAASLGSNFDIIIDDGGHTMKQQITSLKALFPHLKSGGLYVIEDLHTSYWKGYGGRGDFDQPKAGKGTAVRYLQNLIDDLNYMSARTMCADADKIPSEFKQQMSLFQEHIDSIHFYKSLCIIIKR